MKRAELERLAEDLLHIEVVTFVVPDVELHARRVDASSVGSLFEDYRRALGNAGDRLRENASFDDLRAAAERSGDDGNRRIAIGAARLYALLGDDHGSVDLSKLDARQRMELRRLIEVGTRHCAARTVISLDGDIVNEIASDHVDQTTVLSAHNRAVQTAVAYWQGLVGTLASFLGKLFGTVLGK